MKGLWVFLKDTLSLAEMRRHHIRTQREKVFTASVSTKTVLLCLARFA